MRDTRFDGLGAVQGMLKAKRRGGIAISKEIGTKEVRKDCDERATYEGS